MQTNVDSQRCNDGERKGEKRERVRGGGHDLAAGNISPQRPSVGFLSSTNQHSKATQKHTLHINMNIFWMERRIQCAIITLLPTATMTVYTTLTVHC